MTVPPGWRLVPVAPTVEWIEAMHQRTSYPQVRLAIEMMLATAPRHPDEIKVNDGQNSHKKLGGKTSSTRPRRSAR